MYAANRTKTNTSGGYIIHVGDPEQTEPETVDTWCNIPTQKRKLFYNAEGEVIAIAISVVHDIWKIEYQADDTSNRLCFNEGDVGVGQCVGCLLHGQGTLTSTSGYTYEGGFVNGAPSGQGKMTSISGDVYEGSFQDGNLHGQGRRTFANGNVYDGKWQSNQRHGHCTLTYQSGDIYEGEWQHGKEHGRGILTYKSGDIHVAEWQNGKEHGQGKFHYTNGDIMRVSYEHGLQHDTCTLLRKGSTLCHKGGKRSISSVVDHPANQPPTKKHNVCYIHTRNTFVYFLY